MRLEFWGESKPKPTAGDPAPQPQSKRAAKRARPPKGACRQWAESGSCRFGDGCRFAHGEGGGEGKGGGGPAAPPQPDLPGPCPYTGWTEDGGKCPFDDRCRWAGTHGAPAPETAAARAALAALVELPSTPVRLPLQDPLAQKGINTLPLAARDALRGGAYDFSRADAALAAAGASAASCRAADAKARERLARRAERQQQEAAAKGGGGEALLFDAAAAAPSSAADAPAASYVETRLPCRERPALDLRDKLYLAPLTTVGNLPFRALAVSLGADVTCGEMALATSLLQVSSSEWALVRRHPSEKVFGVQLAGGFPDALARSAQAVVETSLDIDFVDINCGCPIDLVTGRGAGSALLTKPARVEQIVRSVSAAVDVPVTLKVRKGWADGGDIVHEWLPRAKAWGAAAVTVHGRSRAQRYSRDADWAYVQTVADACAESGLPVVGNGDVASFTEYEAARAAAPSAVAAMLARGALVKPWLFTEVKERRHWDISAGERFELYARFASLGLTHWGADGRGVEKTRAALLEWLSFAHRYVPVGLLDTAAAPSSRLAWRPPPLIGRCELETLLASPDANDWVRLTTSLLGPVPPGFRFAPKHKSNAYSPASAFD